MEKTPQEMLKAYVDSQKFSSTTEIMNAMKEMFRDKTWHGKAFKSLLERYFG
ncbi:MAG: hypothetical protein HDT19_07535 [Oscillibacter sp.]|nr:hypothetical protein [Oscillibacter sp.]